MGVPAHRSQGLVVAGEPPDSTRRGYGHGQGPRTFGHNGAGGQLAWADPDSGVSFCYLTNGLDEHVIRQARRGIGINTRAVAAAHRRLSPAGPTPARGSTAGQPVTVRTPMSGRTPKRSCGAWPRSRPTPLPT